MRVCTSEASVRERLPLEKALDVVVAAWSTSSLVPVLLAQGYGY